MGSKPFSVLLLAALAVLLAACGQAPVGLHLAGSTSVQPLAEMLAEAYRQRGGARVSIQGGGSTAGVQAVLQGVADVGAISRPLTQDESGRGLMEHTIGYDVLTVVVHPGNPVGAVTKDQLAAVFGGEVAGWEQLGGRPGPIHLISREAGSGSRAAFRTLVGPVSPRAIVQNSAGAIRTGVMGDPGAIGYVSLGTARMGGVKVLLVDGQEPGAAGYPLIRPLALITRGTPTGEAAAFIEFAQSAAGQEILAAEGLVPVRARSFSR